MAYLYLLYKQNPHHFDILKLYFSYLNENNIKDKNYIQVLSHLYQCAPFYSQFSSFYGQYKDEISTYWRHYWSKRNQNRSIQKIIEHSYVHQDIKNYLLNNTPLPKENNIQDLSFLTNLYQNLMQAKIPLTHPVMHALFRLTTEPDFPIRTATYLVSGHFYSFYDKEHALAVLFSYLNHSPIPTEAFVINLIENYYYQKDLPDKLQPYIQMNDDYVKLFYKHLSNKEQFNFWCTYFIRYEKKYYALAIEELKRYDIYKNINQPISYLAREEQENILISRVIQFVQNYVDATNLQEEIKEHFNHFLRTGERTQGFKSLISELNQHIKQEYFYFYSAFIKDLTPQTQLYNHLVSLAFQIAPKHSFGYFLFNDKTFVENLNDIESFQPPIRPLFDFLIDKREYQKHYTHSRRNYLLLLLEREHMAPLEVLFSLDKETASIFIEILWQHNEELLLSNLENILMIQSKRIDDFFISKLTSKLQEFPDQQSLLKELLASKKQSIRGVAIQVLMSLYKKKTSLKDEIHKTLKEHLKKERGKKLKESIQKFLTDYI